MLHALFHTRQQTKDTAARMCTYSLVCSVVAIHLAKPCPDFLRNPCRKQHYTEETDSKGSIPTNQSTSHMAAFGHRLYPVRVSDNRMYTSQHLFCAVDATQALIVELTATASNSASRIMTGKQAWQTSAFTQSTAAAPTELHGILRGNSWPLHLQTIR